MQNIGENRSNNQIYASIEKKERKYINKKNCYAHYGIFHLAIALNSYNFSYSPNIGSSFHQIKYTMHL